MSKTPPSKAQPNWHALYRAAHEAGQVAADAAVPTPMLVGTAVGLSDIIDETKPVYVVRGGLCGFAYIIVRPARGGFVNWMRDNGIGYKHYYGGWTIPARPLTPPDLSQSVEIKEKYARAFAGVLRDHGINCTVETMLD